MVPMQGSVKRARRDRWALGVCSGIAHRYGWKPNMVRLVAAILAIAIPGPSLVISVLAYLALGLLLPTRAEF